MTEVGLEKGVSLCVVHLFVSRNAYGAFINSYYNINYVNLSLIL